MKIDISTKYLIADNFNGYVIYNKYDNISNEEFDIEVRRIFKILKFEDIDYNSRYNRISKKERTIMIYIPFQETKHQFLFDINKE